MYKIREKDVWQSGRNGLMTCQACFEYARSPGSASARVPSAQQLPLSQSPGRRSYRGVKKLIDWSIAIDWSLNGWLTNRSNDWIDWLTDWLIYWFINQLIGWFIDWSINWLEWLVHWLIHVEQDGNFACHLRLNIKNWKMNLKIKRNFFFFNCSAVRMEWLN